MSGSRFLDTNVLVYAIESAGIDPQKSAVALTLVREGDVAISTQVLGEFYRAVTSTRRDSPLSHDEAVAWIQFWKRLPVHTVSVAHVDLALEIAGRFQINYYDALILAVARLAGCTAVYSEDLNTGQEYDGIRVENPFINNQ
ncbi:MAG: PIN domain-containing protein [Planctomycetaceae bacterium]|nr:PIN domain-containing protein [Planctomycetaceae bacterium]